VSFAERLDEEKVQKRQGFREVDGTGVFVISACIGESPRNAKTMFIVNTS
jgi:hypothetical protein